MKNLITRALSGTVYVCLIVGSIVFAKVTEIPFAVLFALFVVVGMYEALKLTSSKPSTNLSLTGVLDILCGLALFFGVYFGLTDAKFFLLLPLSFLILRLVIQLYRPAENAISAYLRSFFALIYVSLPLSLLWFVLTNSNILLLSVFVFIWVNDTGAYCVGSLLGRHKLFPRVSPGKSWEGSIGGAFFVLLAAWGIGWFDNMQVCDLDHQSPIFRGLLTIPEWAGLGLTVVVFGTWGDLVESLFKRTLGIKDSGSILPGHGGMLDRFDSSLLAIPAAVVYLYTLTLL